MELVEGCSLASWLDFSGAYDPPLGLVGDAFDAIALRWIAKESVT